MKVYNQVKLPIELSTCRIPLHDVSYSLFA
jgi:hypothetical protein